MLDCQVMLAGTKDDLCSVQQYGICQIKYLK